MLFFNKKTFITMLLIFASVAWSAPISYQGRLVDSNGVPVSGSVNLQFNIYRGTTLKCSLSAPISVTLNNGVFNVNLDYGTRCESNTKTLEDVLNDAYVASETVSIEVVDTDNSITYPQQVISNVPQSLFSIVAGSVMQQSLSELNFSGISTACSSDQVLVSDGAGKFSCKDYAAVTSGSVGNDELADDAVTSAKIKDGEVYSADIHDGTIVTADIGDAQVTSEKINSVELAKLQATTGCSANQYVVATAGAPISFACSNLISDSVITSTINDQAVTSAKISGLGSCSAGQFVVDNADGSLGCVDSPQLTEAEVESYVANGLTDNYIPYNQDGTKLVDSNIFYNGTQVGIGTSLPSYSLDVTGSVRATGGLFTDDNLTFSNTNKGIVFTDGTYSTVLKSAVGNSDVTLTFPASAGSANQFLTTDGSGTLSWVTPTSGTVVSVSGTAPITSNGASDNVVIGLDFDTNFFNADSNVLSLNNSAIGAAQLAEKSVYVSSLAGIGVSGACGEGEIVKVDGTTGEFICTSGLDMSGDVILNADNNTDGMGEIQFKTNGTQKVVISNAGNVGIGTPSPGSLLELASNTQTPKLSLNNTKSTSDESGVIYFEKSGTVQWGVGNDLAQNGSQVFQIRDYESNADRLYINASGYIGIGNSAPTVKLDVTGDIKSSGTITAATDVIIGSHSVCQSDGTNCPAGSTANGTVTQVDTGTGLTGGPITTTGTISIASGGVTTTEIADGTIANADISSSAAIDASKISSGNVSNTEFDYLDGLTGGIQSQLDNKLNSADAITTFIGLSDTPSSFSGATGLIPQVNVAADALEFIAVDKTYIGLDQVDNVQQMPLSYLDTDDTLAANSDTKVASQKAVKTYVDTEIATANANANNNFVNVGGDTMTGQLKLPADGLAVNTSELVVSGGNVGIGTASPDSRLDVAGNITSGNYDNGDYAQITDSALNLYRTTASDVYVRSRSNGNRLNFGTTTATGELNSSVMSITGEGNIGIGTTAPLALTQVKGVLNQTFAGTVTIASGNTDLKGTGTTFSNLKAGQKIKVGTEVFTISAITDDTNLTVDAAASNDHTDDAIYTQGDLFLVTDYDGNSIFKVTADGASLNNISGTTVTTSSVGDTTISADSDADHSGNILFNTAGTTKMTLANNGDLSLLSGRNAEATLFNLGTDVSNNSLLKWDDTNKFFSLGTTNAGTDYSNTLVLKNGNVGIGTTDPQAKLEVKAGRIRATRSTGQQYIELYGGDDTYTHLAINAVSAESNKKPIIFSALNDETGSAAGENYFQFRVGPKSSPVSVMTIKENGRVGLGTSTPGAPLEIVGTTGSDILISSTAPVLELNETDNSKKWFVAGDNSSFSIREDDTSTQRLSIIAGGNVGIGVVSPAYSLDVGNSFHVGGNSFFEGHVRSTTGGDVTNASIQPGPDADTGLFWPATNTIGFTTTAVERMRIDASGNVGIGTTSPNKLLTISSSSNDTFLQLDNTSNGGHAWNLISSGDGSANPGGSLGFQDQDVGATRMLIDGQGNIGIGTNKPLKKLHVVGNTMLAGSEIILGAGEGASPTDFIVRGPAATGTDIKGANAYFDASNGTGSGGSGDIYFRTASPADGSVVTVGNTDTAKLDGASTVTFSHTVNNNPDQVLIVTVGYTKNDITGITFDGVALTELATENTNTPYVSVWYLVNPSVTTANVVVTLSANTDGSVAATNLYNVNQTTPFSDIQKAADSTISSTLTISSAAGSKVFSAFYTWATPSVGNGQTVLFTSEQYGETTTASIADGAASVSTEWTLDEADKWRHIAFSVNSASATPEGNDMLRTRLVVKNTGKIGIGTTNPSSELHVAASDADNPGIRISNNVNDPRVYIGDPGGTDMGSVYLYKNDGSTGVSLLANGNSYFMNGNIGIGTTTPNANLEVRGDRIRLVDTSNAHLQIANSDTNMWTFRAGSDGKFSLNQAGYDGSDYGTDSVIRLVVDTVGNVGIGTSTPVGTLHVADIGSESPAIYVEGASNSEGDIAWKKGENLNLGTWDTTNNTYSEKMVIEDDGDVIVGGTTVHSSDRRLKKDIVKITNALDRLLQISGVEYFWKDRKKSQEKQIGVIAQDVQKVFPELVKQNKRTGFLAVNYEGLIAPLIEATKEQQREIASLKKENKVLKDYLCDRDPDAPFCLKSN